MQTEIFMGLEESREAKLERARTVGRSLVALFTCGSTSKVTIDRLMSHLVDTAELARKKFIAPCGRCFMIANNGPNSEEPRLHAGIQPKAARSPDPLEKVASC